MHSVIHKALLAFILVATLTACNETPSAVDQYLQTTNQQCPQPLYPGSQSKFIGISQHDTILNFNYQIHESDSLWASIQQNEATLRIDIEAMLSSTLPEMEELLKLLTTHNLALTFNYTLTTHPEHTLPIHFTSQQLQNLWKQPVTTKDAAGRKIQIHLQNLHSRLPLPLTENALLSTIRQNSDTLHLHIILPEEPFMALRLQTPQQISASKRELIHELQKSQLHDILNLLPIANHTLHATYYGKTSNESISLTLYTP